MSKSIAERKKQFLEDCCGGAPTMSMGDVGYQAAAPAEGPMAGYDKPLEKKRKKGVMDTVKKIRKEGFMSEEKKKLTRKERAARTRRRRGVMYDVQARHDALAQNLTKYRAADKSGKSQSEVADMIKDISPTSKQIAQHRRKGVD